jgi:hypothetical protein
MFEQARRNETLFDVANLALGLLLFMAPWMFGFISDVATQNAWASGAVIAVVATEAIVAFGRWEEWINLLVGLWVAASPWLLGFHAEMRIHFIIGILVAALAAVELWIVHRTPPHVAA